MPPQNPGGSSTDATASDAASDAATTDATDSTDAASSSAGSTGDASTDVASADTTSPPAASTGGDPVVRVEDVTFGYGGEPAVEDVSLSIEAGEFVGLVGPNGSGKTTLLHLVLGLLTPDEGRIELFGEPVDEFDDGERLGYVSQRATDRGESMPVTVREVVTMGRFPHASRGRLSEADRAAVERALETVGIADLRDRRVGHLSGGQVQRTFIARALAGEADLLALDEPTVGVDARSCEDFYGLLGELNDAGMTVILIDHDIGVVTDRADRIACINRTLFHHGDPAEFLESDALDAAYGPENAILSHHHH